MKYGRKITKKLTYDTIKVKIKDERRLFREKFKHKIDTPAVDNKCCTDYRFP